jgi:hypothetical protein
MTHATRGGGYFPYTCDADVSARIWFLEIVRRVSAGERWGSDDEDRAERMEYVIRCYTDELRGLIEEDTAWRRADWDADLERGGGSGGSRPTAVNCAVRRRRTW